MSVTWGIEQVLTERELIEVLAALRMRIKHLERQVEKLGTDTIIGETMDKFRKEVQSAYDKINNHAI